jgi:hypothetical protein
MGAVAAFTTTVVVAEFNALAAVAVVAVAALPPILKLVTGVVEVTVNGAVPIATVDKTVVNLPVDAVVAPTVTLSIEPNVAGLMVTTPVPVGLNTTLALAGDNVTVELADNVVNAPVDAVVAPIVVPLIEPPVITTADGAYGLVD